MAERKWTGKSRGNKTGHQIFVFLLQKAGIKAAYFLLVFVSFYYFATKWKTNKNIHIFYKKLGFGLMKSWISVYKNYFVFGQSLIDRIAVKSGVSEKFTYDFDGESYLHEMEYTKKGGILLSAHAGNWDIAGHFLDRIKSKVHILMLDAEYEKLKDYLEQVTGKAKVHVILIKEDQSHIYQIMDALSKSELICVHADRILNSKQKKIIIPFLGEEAEFPYSIFKMIHTLDVPVSFVFAFKEKNQHYHFFASKGIKYRITGKEEEVQLLARDYVNELENKVSLYPLQWYNYFNFWEKETA